MTHNIRMMAIAAIATASLASQAFAHAHLKSAVPATDSTVAQAPTELDLSFTEGLNLKFSGITLTGPGKVAIKTGDGMLTDGDTTLKIPVSGTLSPGTYSVDWHALSNDGHKTNGSYGFTVKP